MFVQISFVRVSLVKCSRIDVSEDIDTSKTDGLREYIVCHHWYFLKIKFRFQAKLCDSCHDMTQKLMNFSNFAIVIVKKTDYGINFRFMTESKAADRMKNANLSEKNEKLLL